MELKQTNQFPIKIRTMEGQERKIIVQNSTSIAFIKSHIEAVCAIISVSLLGSPKIGRDLYFLEDCFPTLILLEK